jgi:hypothetical protein
MKKTIALLTLLALMTMPFAAFAEEPSMGDVAKKWAAAESFSKEGGLPEESICRLLITYFLDLYPELSFTQLSEFEPMCRYIDLEGKPVYLCTAFTHKSGVALTVDAITGELLNVAEDSGGNG